MDMQQHPEIHCQLFRKDNGNKYKIIIRCDDRPDIVLLEVDPDYKIPAFLPLLTK